MRALVLAILVGLSARVVAETSLTDQGQHDPRLKGIALAPGYRLGIVDDRPVTALCVADDGTFFASNDVETWTFRIGEKGAIVDRQLVPALAKFRPVLVHDGWVYTTALDSLQRRPFTRLSQPPEVVLRGIQMGVPAIGPDRWLYVPVGTGEHFGKDGPASRLQSYSPGVLRMRPDGSQVQLFSTGLNRPVPQITFDSMTHLFVPTPEARFAMVAEAASVDPVTGTMFRNTITSLESAAIPEPRRQSIAVASADQLSVLAYPLIWIDGVVRSRAPAKLLLASTKSFRVNQLVVGPDGAVYVAADRLYRLTWIGGDLPDGTTAEPVPLRGGDSWSLLSAAGADLWSTIRNGDPRSRQIALARLVDRQGADLREKLRERVLDDLERTDVRIACLTTFATLGGDEARDLCTTCLGEGNVDVRRVAAATLGRIARAEDLDAIMALEKLLDDRSPGPRRAAALSLGALSPGSVELLANALRFDDMKSDMLTEGLVRGVERLGQSGVEKVLELAQSGKEGDRDRAVNAFRMMRTRPGAEMLWELVSDPHLTADQRVALVKHSATFQLKEPVSAEPFAKWLARNPNQSPELAGPAFDALSAHADNLRHVAMVANAFLSARDSSTRMAAIEAIRERRLADGAPALRRLAEDASADAGERSAAIAAWATLRGTAKVDDLRPLLRADVPASVQATALTAISSIDHRVGAEMAHPLLSSEDKALRQAAVQARLATIEGARSVAQALMDKKLSRDNLSQVFDGLQAHARLDKGMVDWQRKVMIAGLVGESVSDRTEESRRLVLTRGDPVRGRELFLGSKLLGCVSCHQLEGRGGQTGPDLSGIADRRSVVEVIESIVDPGRRVDPGFKAKSTMPDHLLGSMKFGEVLDLTAFLQSRQAQQVVRELINEVELVHLAGWTAPEKLRWADLKTADAKVVAAAPNGVVSVVREKQSTVSIARLTVRSPAKQSITLRYGSTGASIVWLNGERVQASPTTQVAAESQIVALELAEGVNELLISVEQRSPRLDLSIRLRGQDLKVTARPE